MSLLSELGNRSDANVKMGAVSNVSSQSEDIPSANSQGRCSTGQTSNIQRLLVDGFSTGQTAVSRA